MNVQYPIPNENIIRLAEKEEPRFLHILLKDKDSLQDAIAFGIKRTKSGEAGHFLVPKNNFLYAMIHDNFLKYGTLLSRGAMDSIMEGQDYGTDEDKAAMKSHWDKVWNHNAVSLSDYQLLRDHINDRYVAWQFYDKWKGGDEIIQSTTGHASKVKEFMKGINAIDNIEADPYSQIVGIEDGVKNAMEYVKQRREHPEVIDTVKCGLKTIDDVYSGFERGSYTVISGMINGGKTTLMMNMGFNMAKAGYNVAYVSLEKKATVFFRKLLSLHAAVDYNRIKRGGTQSWGLSDIWYDKLREAAKDLTENIKPHYNCLQFVQKTKLTKILSEIDKLRAQKKVDVLIVDYLQVIGFETNHATRPDLDLADVHQRLIAYGRTHNMVVITALQLKASSSKEIRKKAAKIATEVDIAALGVDPEDYSGSQMIIADADNALGVVLNADKPPTKMFISVSKARDDESRRTLGLDFDGRICRVSDPLYDPNQVEAMDPEKQKQKEKENKIYKKKIDEAIYSGKDEKTLSSDEDLFGAVDAPSSPLDEKGSKALDEICGSNQTVEIKKEDVAKEDAETAIVESKEEKEEEKPSGKIEVEDKDDSDDLIDGNIDLDII